MRFLPVIDSRDFPTSTFMTTVVFPPFTAAAVQIYSEDDTRTWSDFRTSHAIAPLSYGELVLCRRARRFEREVASPGSMRSFYSVRDYLRATLNYRESKLCHSPITSSYFYPLNLSLLSVPSSAAFIMGP